MSEKEFGPERTFPGQESHDISDLKSPEDIERDLKEVEKEMDEAE